MGLISRVSSRTYRDLKMLTKKFVRVVSRCRGLSSLSDASTTKEPALSDLDILAGEEPKKEEQTSAFKNVAEFDSTNAQYESMTEPLESNKAAFRITGYPIPGLFNPEKKEFTMLTCAKGRNSVSTIVKVSMRSVANDRAALQFKEYYTYNELRAKVESDDEKINQDSNLKPQIFSIQGTFNSLENQVESALVIDAEFVKSGNIPLLKVVPIEALNMTKLAMKASRLMKHQLIHPNLDHKAYVKFVGTIQAIPKKLSLIVGKYEYSFVLQVNRGFPFICPVIMTEAHFLDNPELNLVGTEVIVTGRLNEQQIVPDTDSRLYVIMAKKINVDKLNTAPESIHKSSNPEDYLDEEEELTDDMLTKSPEKSPEQIEREKEKVK